MSVESAQFQTLMNQGHTAVWDQDWELAAEKYRLALDEYPDHPTALASLGLAQFSHETTPAMAQLCFTAVIFYAVAAMPYHEHSSRGLYLLGLILLVRGQV